MIKFRKFLTRASLLTAVCLIVVLIPATFLPYRQSTAAIYNAPWFLWGFGSLFFSLSVGHIFAGLTLKQFNSIVIHAGIILILVGSFLSGRSTQGEVVVSEGESFQSFRSTAMETHSFTSPIALLKFKEEEFSNRVRISGDEHIFSPSHPLRMWDYYFYASGYDVKWDIRKVVITDASRNEYMFEPHNRRHLINPYFVNFIGLVVNNDGDTLSEFVISRNDTLIGAVFVGRDGIEMPSYGLDLRLVDSDLDVSYSSTIFIKKDPGLPYALIGFTFCLVGFVITISAKRWMS